MQISPLIKGIKMDESRMAKELSQVKDMIDAYGLTKLLAEDDAEEISLSYSFHEIDGHKVQSIFGGNFRVNYFVKTGELSIVVNKTKLEYAAVENFKQQLKELRVKNRMKYKPNGGGYFTLTASIELNEEDQEKVIALFTGFDIK